MINLDVKTKNIIKALENLIDVSKKQLPEKTHEQIVQTLIKHTTEVLNNYRLYKDGSISYGSYKTSLLKLAEITLMGILRLPG